MTDNPCVYCSNARVKLARPKDTWWCDTCRAVFSPIDVHNLYGAVVGFAYRVTRALDGETMRETLERAR